MKKLFIAIFTCLCLTSCHERTTHRIPGVTSGVVVDERAVVDRDGIYCVQVRTFDGDLVLDTLARSEWLHVMNGDTIISNDRESNHDVVQEFLNLERSPEEFETTDDNNSCLLDEL